MHIGTGGDRCGTAYEHKKRKKSVKADEPES